MAIIPKPQLFSGEHVEASSDLDRLRMALESMPDEELMRALEAERKGRRGAHPGPHRQQASTGHLVLVDRFHNNTLSRF